MANGISYHTQAKLHWFLVYWFVPLIKTLSYNIILMVSILFEKTTVNHETVHLNSNTWWQPQTSAYRAARPRPPPAGGKRAFLSVRTALYVPKYSSGVCFVLKTPVLLVNWLIVFYQRFLLCVAFVSSTSTVIWFWNVNLKLSFYFVCAWFGRVLVKEVKYVLPITELTTP